MANQVDESKPLNETRVMFGRRIIKTSVTEITEDNVVDVLNKAMATHSINRSEIDYLWKYYRGDQPILRRKKDVRPEICNKIVENRANEIVSFKVGYLCGEPIQYVSRKGGEEIVSQINALNEMMFAEDKAAQDQELVEWQMVCGTAYRLVLPDEPREEDEAPFELYTLDPRDTFVVYSNEIGNKPIMAVKYSKDDDEIFHYSIYTENRYFHVDGDILNKEKSKPHALNMVPIFEYPANNARLGAFEIVLPLLDAINKIDSNRLDGIEQLVQAFIKFIIPTISQAISLVKSGWSSVKNWIGYLPVISQGISLFKSGWYSISSFVGTSVSVGVSLFRSGWSSLSSWIGNRVSVGISLFKSGWSSIKSFFGLSSGGYNTGHGFQMFSGGGYINAKGNSGFWKSIPMYANGTANAGLHGSMFVAGENGAEMVGHINGQTEVLNRSQIAQAMKSAVVAGMSQFTGYWRTINSQMVVCSNAIIRSILVSSDVMNASLATVGGSYDPTNALAQSVYEDSQRAYNNSYSEESLSRAMREFYQEYVEPTLKEIASDTKRQADKEEQTIVQVGNRTISDAVVTQQKANGYSFTK